MSCYISKWGINITSLEWNGLIFSGHILVHTDNVSESKIVEKTKTSW